MRSFIGGASDCATRTPLISPLAGFHDRRWILGFGIDLANPQIFRLMKRDSSVIYLFSKYLLQYTVSTWRASAGRTLWETVGQPLVIQASTAGLLHLDRLDTQEPLGAGTVDPPICFSPEKLASRFSAGSSGPFLCSAEGPCRNHTLGSEPVCELGLCTHVNLTVGRKIPGQQRRAARFTAVFLKEENLKLWEKFSWRFTNYCFQLCCSFLHKLVLNCADCC